MITKTASVADGTDCVCNRPGMDQLLYSSVVHKKSGDVPTSIHLLSYSYMTHLYICEAITLAWTCPHHHGAKALNTMPESCFHICNKVIYPSVQTGCSSLSTVAYWRLNWKNIFVWVRWNSFVRYTFLETAIGVNSVLWVIFQLTSVRTASNDNFHYQNIVYVYKGFHSSGSCKNL